MSGLLLLSDQGCPFAHRVRALVHHLDLDVEQREAPVGSKPAGVERYSASRGVPVLVDGDLVLTESRVMLEHLAERHRFGGALPEDLRSRTLHRQAMAVVDEWVVGALQDRRALDGPRLLDVLGALEAAVATTGPEPCLLAFHVAPIWLHLSRFRPGLPVTQAILARPALRAWLDAAVSLPGVQATRLDDARVDHVVAQARAAGFLPPPPSSGVS